MENMIIMALCCVFVAIDTTTSQPSCVLKGHDGVKEWVDNQPLEVVAWEPNKVCHTYETCYGASFSSPSYFPPQIIPLLTQPNAMIVFQSTSKTIRFFRTNEDGFSQCKLEEKNLVSDLSNVKVSLGSNYFVANDTANPWNKCSVGLRLNITTLPFMCSSSPPSSFPSPTSTCSGKGKCLASPFKTSYQCVCCGGYVGDYCEKLDGCFSNTPICLNGGYCTDGPDISTTLSSFTCLCSEGFTGGTCEQEDTGACRRNQCMNGGVCVEDDKAANGFTCRCAAGYTGQACETEVNECASLPCQNGGLCVDGVNKYTCECPKWFSGGVCEVDGRPCRAGVCKNGGSCVEGEGGSAVCYCPIGFSGIDCSVEGMACFPNPCKNSTECIAYSNNSYACICQPEFYGVNCDLKVNISNPSCASSPCQRGGVCEERAVGYQCRCDDGGTRLDCGVNNTSSEKALDIQPTSDPSDASSPPLYAFIVIGIVVIIVILLFIILLIVFLNRRKSPPPYQPYTISGEMQMKDTNTSTKASSPSQLFQDDSFPDETLSYSTSTLSSNVSYDRSHADSTPVVKRSVKKNVVA